MPSFSRLYHHFRGTGPSTKTTTKSKSGLVTFGSSENKGKSGKGGNLSNTMARYMGTRSTGMTTLGSQGGSDNEDTIELRTHDTSTAKASGEVTPPTYTQMDDL